MQQTKLLLTVLLSLCLGWAISLSAQGTVQGVVLGEDEPEGLISATVRVSSTGTVTEYDGSFSLSLPAGTHTINISYTGYDSYEETFTLADGDTKTIQATLKLTANLLKVATVTSGKYEKPLGEVTVSMEVIKPDLAEATNSNSVEQVLDRVPGVTIVDGQANIRGGSGFSYGAGSRVLLLVDDIPILSGDAGFPYWGDVPTENISQVEVVKGAASALYGSSALNGIINVRTAYAKSKPETQVAFYIDVYDSPKDEDKKWWAADSIDLNRILFPHSTQGRKWSATDSISRPSKMGVTLVHRQKFGKLDLVAGGSGYVTRSYIQNAKDNKLRATTKLRYRHNENLSYGVYTNFNIGESNTIFLWNDSESGAYSSNDANMTNSDVLRFNIDPFLTYTDKSGNQHRSINRFFRSDNQNANDQSNSSNVIYNEYQFQRRLQGIGLSLTAGLVSTYTQSQGSLYGDFTFKSNNIAAYLQTEKKFHLSRLASGDQDTQNNILNLTFGARYEYNRLQGPDTLSVSNIPNPIPVGEPVAEEARPVFRLGMSYQANEYTFFRASWGQGYRFPSVAEKYITTNVSIIGVYPNPSLESETGWSSEIGIKQGYRLGGIEGFVDVSGFWSQYQNMMEFNFTSSVEGNPVFGFQSQNIGDTDIKGFEVSTLGRTKMSSNVNLKFLLGYTYINPKFKEFEAVDFNNSPEAVEDILNSGDRGRINGFFSTSDENVLKYRNRHTFKSDIEATFMDQYVVGVSLNGASRMVAIDETLALGAISDIGDYNTFKYNEGYAIFDLRLGYIINETYKVALIGKNLANKEYMSRPGQLQPMRSYSIRFDAKF